MTKYLFSLIFEDPKSIKDSNFSNADFTGSIIYLDAEDSNFKNAKFNNSILSGYVESIDFTGADFTDSIFSMKAQYSDFVNADFRGSSFGVNPNITYAFEVINSIEFSDLTGANFEGTDWEKIRY